ncbi:MAG: hypothetical protein ABFR32_07045 [Bacteroidota bacterium]
MTKIISITISLLILIQSININLHDFIQFDELIEHAKFHQNKYGDNFIEFFSKHYGDQINSHSGNHQDEKNEHEQLPFHKDCDSHISTTFVISNIKFTIKETKQVKYLSSNFFYLESFSSFEQVKVFQPPKQV